MRSCQQGEGGSRLKTELMLKLKLKVTSSLNVTRIATELLKKKNKWAVIEHQDQTVELSSEDRRFSQTSSPLVHSSEQL